MSFRIPSFLIFSWTRAIGFLSILFYKAIYQSSFAILPPYSVWGGLKIYISGDGSLSILRGFHCVSSELRSFFTLQGPTTISALGGRVFIGEGVGINGSSIFSTKSVSIGARSMIAPGCIICDTDSHHIDNPELRWTKKGPSQPIVIGADVWIGARTIVLKGVSIGDGTVVGAGSIVTKSLPANVLAAGVPARVLRPLEGMPNEV